MTSVLHKNLVGADAVHPAAFVQATDPGTVGPNLFWIDTSVSPPALKIRNTGNTAWTTFAAGSNGATGATGANGATGAAGPPGSNIVSGAAPYVCVQDQKPSGTNGGTATSGSFATRTLNTIVANDGLLVAFVNNQITLPAGTYRCRIDVPATTVDRHQARLQNITDSGTLLLGTSAFNAASAIYASATSVISGRFSLSSQKVLEVQHRIQTTSANAYALGMPASFGIEVYTVAEFWLEGPPTPFFGTTFANPGLDKFVTRAIVAELAGAQQSLTTLPQ